MKRGTALTALMSLACAPAAVRAETTQPPPPSISRNRVREIIAANRKIVSPHGIEDLISIPVNGSTQWLSIRGRDVRNPILLYIHGGPGSPTMPAAWTFQGPWEDYFTVVQWDQRGTGKTYAANDPDALAPSMTEAQIVDDARRVAEYLLERFNKQKLIALGHSWGSNVGLNLAHRNPSLLHAYVGVGQMIDSARSEADGYAFALQQAKAHANADAVKKLESLAPYPGPIGTMTIDRISAQREWVMFYGGLTQGRTDFQYDADTWSLSPDYSDKDIAHTDDGSMYSLKHLLGAVERVNFNATTQFACPIFIFNGRHDYTTSHKVIANWYEGVRAPHKELVWFENSAHMMMVEQPGKFVSELVQRVRPMAS